MSKIISITPVNSDPFVITWDLGRRCNYDCSYCPPHRHDNFSPHASLESLKETVNFLFSYIDIISKYRKHKDFHVAFTGGEPTVHPKFIEFAKYIKKEYAEKYSKNFNLDLTLTTNGAMSEKIATSVIETFQHVTVSYHVEADQYLKNQVLTRIRQFHQSNIDLKINVMFHSQYFDECKDFCDLLKNESIGFIPRVLGEDPSGGTSSAHKYTQEQIEWLASNWGIKVNNSSEIGASVGRPCCGGRTFGTCSSEGVSEVKSINYRKFKDWYCSVNWYFLHIEQQEGLIYHHQTCKATFDKTAGPIGTIDKWQDIVSNLKINLENNTMPVIECPNTFCGCGLCTPKSIEKKDLLESLDKVLTNTDIFANN